MCVCLFVLHSVAASTLYQWFIALFVALHVCIIYVECHTVKLQVLTLYWPRYSGKSCETLCFERGQLSPDTSTSRYCWVSPDTWYWYRSNPINDRGHIDNAIFVDNYCTPWECVVSYTQPSGHQCIEKITNPTPAVARFDNTNPALAGFRNIKFRTALACNKKY